MNQPITQAKFERRISTVLFGAAIAILIFAFSSQAQTAAFVQQAKLEAGDGAAQDSLGFSVAISGDTAIVGSPRNTGGTNLQNRGSAYIYVRNSSTGAWTFQQKLTPSDGAATDQFGYSVAINGNTAAVGRYNTTTGLNRADGRVYIFTRTGTTWAQTQILTSSDIAQGDLFGNSLAFENDTLVVGALNKNNGNNFFQGAVYVFTRPAGGGNFTEQAKLVSNDGGLADFFGYSVALSGDTVVVGAPGQIGSGAGSGRGWAYIFTRSGSTWNFQQKLLASDGAAGDAFGFSVAVSSETAVVGARLDDNGSIGDQGSAYVFVRSGATWTEQQKLLGVETVQRNDQFGSAVAIKGDTIAVGSPAHEFIGTIANHGAVYVFNRTGTTWTRADKLVHNDPAPDALGTSLAFDGSSIISGAPSKNSARGAAYVFALDANAPLRLTASDAEPNMSFGDSIAVSGDTAVIGATLMRNGTSTEQGAAYVFVRSGANWIQQAKLLPTDIANSSRFGNSVAISGDTIVIGAEFNLSNTGNFQGAAYVFTRTGTSWTQQAKLTASDAVNNMWFGSSVAIENDTVVVGARNATVGANQNQGAAYIFTRTGATWVQQQKISASDGAAGRAFGVSTAISGNTIFVGDFFAPPSAGAVYVFNRTGATWTETQKLTGSNNPTSGSGRFGVSLAVKGDTLLIGSTQTQTNGRAYIFTRNNGTWTETQVLAPTDAGTTGIQFGNSVALSDNTLIVGANLGRNSAGNATGAAYIFSKNGQTWTQSSKFTGSGNPANFDSIGRAVAISGSAGFVTDNGATVGGTRQGAAFVLSLGATSSRAAYDFDGDGKSDLSVFRPTNGTWYLQNSTSGFTGAQFGANGDRIVPADYDGDGKTDLAVYRAGIWYLQRSQAGFTGVNFGASEDIPVPADYDGDGKADVAVFRPSNGTWYLQRSTAGFTGIAFGQAGDKPTIGDFDGDGKADVAVYRSSNGGWYRINSSNNQVAATQFGTAEDLVVPADYDGDGKTDVAVFRPSTGIWYLQRSQLGFTGIAFGQTGDKPVPADYDGDGKADVAVYRAGAWYLQRSTAGFIGIGFGASDDLPAPNAFVR